MRIEGKMLHLYFGLARLPGRSRSQIKVPDVLWASHA
jgi:hypothetical protein